MSEDSQFERQFPLYRESDSILDRPRGVLNTADREYLSPAVDDNELYPRQRRQKIRRRIHDSFADFSLLLEQLSERDRELVFEDYVADGLPPRSHPFHVHGSPYDGFSEIEATLAFVIMGLKEVDVDPSRVLARALRLAETEWHKEPQRKVVPSVSLQLETEVKFGTSPVSHLIDPEGVKLDDLVSEVSCEGSLEGDEDIEVDEEVPSGYGCRTSPVEPIDSSGGKRVSAEYQHHGAQLYSGRASGQ